MESNKFIFQQHNDPKHTSKLAMDFFKDKNVELLPWPAQSPDMDPIENQWGIVKSEVNDLASKNKDELKDVMNKSWNKIKLDVTIKLVESFQKRAMALLVSQSPSYDFLSICLFLW